MEISGACVAGYQNKKLSESNAMLLRTLLKESVQWRFNRDLNRTYLSPGIYADTEELIDLCKVIEAYG